MSTYLNFFPLEAAGLVTFVSVINDTVAQVARRQESGGKKKKEEELMSLFISDDLSRGSAISYFCARQMVSVRRTEQADALLSTRRGHWRPLQPLPRNSPVRSEPALCLHIKLFPDIRRRAPLFQPRPSEGGDGGERPLGDAAGGVQGSGLRAVGQPPVREAHGANSCRGETLTPLNAPASKQRGAEHMPVRRGGGSGGAKGTKDAE